MNKVDFSRFVQARLQKHTGFVCRNVGTVAHWLGSLCEHVRTKVDKGLNGFVDIIHDYVKFGPHHGLCVFALALKLLFDLNKSSSTGRQQIWRAWSIFIKTHGAP
jgi:hypothetical protein